MKLLSYLMILALIAGCIISGCSNNSAGPKPPRDLTNSEKAIVESGNEFGIELFRQVVQNNPDSNVCISSISVALALGMAYNGGRNTTKEAMDSVLGLEGLDIEEANQAYKSMIDLLIDLDPAVTFEVANSIWYSNSFDISPTFVDLNRNYFYADVSAVDFSDPNMVDVINSWVNDKTHGKIEKIIDGIDRGTVMILANAIYFLGDWQYQFDPEDTYQTDFFVSPDLSYDCLMMSQENNYECYNASSCDIVRLPYGDGYFNMLLLLPDINRDIDEIISQLTADSLSNWIDHLHQDSAIIKLPKFVIEYEDSLNNALTQMGMGIAFNPSEADFSGMEANNPPSFSFFIDLIRHKTYIEVDEEGTEAAAVTIIETRGDSTPPVYCFNRPFIFMITENHSNTILFAGKVVRPVWED